MMKEVPKFLDELIGRLRRLARLTNGGERFLLLLIKGVRSASEQPNCLMSGEILEGGMKDFGLPDDSPLLAQSSQIPLDGLGRSVISLRLDLLPKLCC
jgi:hypothetical protein